MGTNLNFFPTRDTMKLIKRIFVALLLCALGVVLSLEMAPLPAGLVPSLSPVVYSTEGVILRAFLAPGDKWRLPVQLDTLPNFFSKDLLCLEDQRFYYHPGIDPIALLRAIWQNVKAGRVISGASTITMQVVRLLEPRPRTWVVKIFEVWRALQLEWHLSKERILQLYLTYAPYGGNVEGITAASHLYFGHAPQTLSRKEAVFLYLLPQSPSRWHSYEVKDWQQAEHQVLQRLSACGSFNQHQVGNQKRTPLPRVRRQFPRHAAHFSAYLRRRHPARQRFNTTISIDVQRLIEQVAKRRQKALAAEGIHNVALLVADNATRSLLGIIGNFDDLSTEHGQHIASFAVPRSPGSTLKPFLYALALDEGKILPGTLLLDVPTVYDQYAPGNFSGSFSGLVAAQTALSESLNVPFVRLLQEIGVSRFLSFLELGGLQIASARDRLGLSMIIGGIEITPLQMLSLYTHLANGGKSARLRVLKTGEAAAAASNWLSPGAVHLTEIALAKRDRPDFPQRNEVARYSTHIRWKTGTSQGRRDAWSIGYDDQHTVLVWLGNLNQEPSMALTGANRAAPIMFEILEGLHQRDSRSYRVADLSGPERHLIKLDICAFSGDRASRFCPIVKTGWGIRGHIPTHVCRFHKPILRDARSGLRLLKGCDQGLAPELRYVLDLPAQVLKWMQPIDPRQTLLPPFHPQCRYLPVSDATLRIRSPQQGARYVILPSFGQRQLHLPFSLDASGGTDNFACFLNGRQLAATPAGIRPFLSLGPGIYHLFCSTSEGASDTVEFEVQSPSAMPRLPM
jgi:penicillin-binding protein 1C